MTRAWELADAFGIDHLRLTRRDAAAPRAGEVRVKLGCAALNYRDLMMIRGQYNPRQPLPLIPLSDAVGTIEEVGSEVQGLDAGQRVACLFVQGWVDGPPSRLEVQRALGGPLDGVLRKNMVLPAYGVAPVPDYLTDEQACTLPCAALTAWSALFGHGALTPADTVLVQGTGGVSTFALLWARAAGAKVIATSSSEDKLRRVKELGAHETINYRDDDKWGATARRISGGEGVDRVIEVGGAGTLEQSLHAVRPGGTIAMIGVLAGGKAEVDVRPILMRGVRVQGIYVGNRRSFEAMCRALTEHELRPVIDRVFDFEEAPEALRYLERGEHFGKVCIRIAPAS